MDHGDTTKAMNKDRSFLAVVGQLYPEEHPQATMKKKANREAVAKAKGVAA
jgi:hypothetical protein